MQFESDVAAELLAAQAAILRSGDKTRPGLYEGRWSAYEEIRRHETDMLRLDLAERKKQWELQMRAIVARGQMEWTDGERRMKGRYEAWLKESRAAYAEKSEAWNLKYLSFLKDKEAWVVTVRAQSTRIGDEDVLASFGQATQAAIEAAGADIAVTALERGKDPESILAESLDLELLSTLLDNAKSLNEGITAFKPTIFTALEPDKYTSAELLQRIKDAQSGDNDELRRRTATMQYERFMDQVRAAERGMAESIKRANEGVDQGLNATLIGAGYTRSGAVYEKDAVVGGAVTGLIKKRVNVKTYSYFQADAKAALADAKIEANADQLLTMGLSDLDALLDKAVKTIEKRTKEIFGDDEDLKTFSLPSSLTERDKTVTTEAGTWIDGKYKGDESKITKVEQRFVQEINTIRSTWDYEEEYDYDSLDEEGNPKRKRTRVESFEVVKKVRGVDMSPGLFGAHVGYAPGFSDKVEVDPTKAWNAEGNIDFSGLGEMGTIMGQFIYNSMLESKGWGEANLPGYSKPLWDASDFIIPFKAPSYRQVVDMGVTIAATIATAPVGGLGGALIGAGMGLADDALFTLLDVQHNQMTWDEGLVSFGKQTAMAGVNVLIGGAFNGFDGAKGVSGIFGKSTGLMSKVTATGVGGVIAKTTLVGLQTMTSSLASSAISSITYSSDKGFGFSDEAFAQGMKGGMTSALSGMASTFTGGMLGDFNLKDGNNVDLASTVFDRKGIGSFNNLMGGLAGQAVSYGLTGEASFNIARLSTGFTDVSGNQLSFGLLELKVGKNGTSLGLGSNGMDISLGTISSSLSGLIETMDIARLKFGGREGLSTLNAINQHGYTKSSSNWDLAKRVKTRKQMVEYEDIDGGLGTIRDGKIILDSRLLGGGLEESAQLAALMAHEDEHLLGGGEEDAYMRELQGFSELQEQWNITGNKLISGIGEMATFYKEHGRDATLSRLENQGLLRGDGANKYTGVMLSKDTEDWVTKRYGFDSALKQSVFKSEGVREMYGKGAIIRKDELSDFLDGESLRLGTEADYREAELKKLADLKSFSENIKDKFSRLAEDDKKRLQDLGINIDACTSAGGALVEATQAVFLKLAPIYMDMLLGQVVDGLAGKVGVSLFPGVAGTTGNMLGKYIRTGEVSLPAIDDYREELLTDTAAQIVGTMFKGKQKSQVGAVVDIFAADFQAAIQGYAFATEVSGLAQEYRDAMKTVELGKRAFTYINEIDSKDIAKEMVSYQAAEQFMASGLEDMDQALKNYLFRFSRGDKNAYDRLGYNGNFSVGTHKTDLLKQILSMTSDAQIYQSFKATVSGFEWYKGDLYISGLTTNTKLSDIYGWRDNKQGAMYPDLKSWIWTPRRGTIWR